MTYHAAKGLEWPVAVLTSLNDTARTSLWGVRARTDGDFDPADPLARRIVHFWPRTWGQFNAPQPAADAESSELGQELALQAQNENRRLLYVGMTRARKRLYLMRALRRAVFGNSEPTKRSRFLADIPMEQLTVLTNNGTVAPRPARATPNPAYQGWGNAAAFQQPKSAPMLEFSVGDHVRHQRFGEGIVLAAKVVDDDVEVVVRFADRAVGEKKLIASFARLQKITLPEDPS